MRFTLATSIVALAVLTAAVPQSAGSKNGLAIRITKRSGLVNADRSISVRSLNSHVASVTAKVLRGLGNFQKNTGASHPAALTGIHRRATGAVPLVDDNNQLWYGSISVGTPPKDFTVDFDTGSSDLFLPGSQCTTSCDGHTIYSSSSSSTSQDLGQTFNVSYADGGYVWGEEFSDTVSVAGLTAVSQTFGVASEYSSSLAVGQFPPDGLMGMGFQSISAYNNASPVFESLVSQGQTDAPVFSFKLATSGAELYLGGADSALYTGDFTYTPVTHAGYWEVNMDSVEGNGQTILSNIDSIIDTGSTLIIGVPSEVASLYQALGGTDASSTVGPGYYTFPCKSFPDISFTFGGTSFPIPASTLNIGQTSAGSPDCLSGIVGKDTGSSFWIVGDVFLQNVYTTFDLGNQQVGFAQLA